MIIASNFLSATSNGQVKEIRLEASDNVEVGSVIMVLENPELTQAVDEAKLEAMLIEHENPAKILDTNWYAIKPMYEKKYKELVRDNNKFTSINDIRLTIKSVKKSIHYLREIYRHRISKTQVISLNSKMTKTTKAAKPPQSTS